MHACFLARSTITNMNCVQNAFFSILQWSTQRESIGRWTRLEYEHLRMGKSEIELGYCGWWNERQNAERVAKRKEKRVWGDCLSKSQSKWVSAWTKNLLSLSPFSSLATFKLQVRRNHFVHQLTARVLFVSRGIPYSLYTRNHWMKYYCDYIHSTLSLSLSLSLAFFSLYYSAENCECCSLLCCVFSLFEFPSLFLPST